MSERRTEMRLMCADLLHLKWTGGGGGEEVTSALVEDVSTYGMCVQTEVPVPTGTPVTLSYGGQSIRASVSYSLYKEIGFFVGLTFLEGFRWSSERIYPRHLLDLRELVAGPQQGASTM